MPDMLVRLYDLPDPVPAIKRVESQGITIRRAKSYEASIVRSFIERHFTVAWADEVTVGLTRHPISVYIAVVDDRIIGFGAYECTCRGFFGPTGVRPEHRGQGVGQALLIKCLQGLADEGYAYGIIGGAGPTDFYTRTVGAEVIDRSVPGIYTPVCRLDSDDSEGV